ncbi:hypothetical protein OO009_01030 [Flavobacteriaceae bacterium KMM 6897]|nr:hypothetical protein [Flavobacteriaceae bacterium KMM 6897]
MLENSILYYLIILVPLGALIMLHRTAILSGYAFVGFLFFYAFIYRTFTDGKRLYDKQIIFKKDIWKMIMPGSRIQFFKELYF